MIINSNILKQFIPIKDDILTTTNQNIIEVDHYALINQSTPLIIGQVLTKVKHPDAQKLSVTTVNIGTKVLQIVCGAANVDVHQLVIVAPVGTILSGNFMIKEAVIRGVESQGMICSLTELGFDEKYLSQEEKEGIYVIKDNVKVGADALAYLGQSGFTMQLALTPNRSDLLSHYGFAKDLCAVTNVEFITPDILVEEDLKLVNDLKVAINTNLANRYLARKMKVEIKESPWFIKSALISAGIRPINNVVDITNYVMLEYGVPLHAFDRQKLDSDTIIVKTAKDQETVITLDEQKRILSSNDVVITNANKVIAVAGVMGSFSSAIDQNTKEIVLEAASFNSEAVRQTSKRLGLRSESSLRFERGVDCQNVKVAIERASQLLIEHADAKVYQGIAECINIQKEEVKIEVSKKYINSLLGAKLQMKDILSILDRLEYLYSADFKTNIITLNPPHYRNDITQPADVVEEIARIYGINKIVNQPLKLATIGKLSVKQKNLRTIRQTLSGIGLNEAITYSLTKESNINQYQNVGEMIKVLKPLSEDKKILRQSILPSLLEMVSYNKSRSMEDIAVYEIGSVFANGYERPNLSIVLTGNLNDTLYLKNDTSSSFYYLKGILDYLLKRFSLSVQVKPGNYEFLHPGISGSIYLNEENIGYIGKLHPTLADDLDLKDVYVLELKLELIINHSEKVKFVPIAKYPSMLRDLSFVVDKSFAVADIIDLIQQTAKKLITDVRLFDVYEGVGVDEGQHSLAVSITFNDLSKTLETADVEKAIKSIKNRLQHNFNAIIR